MCFQKRAPGAGTSEEGKNRNGLAVRKVVAPVAAEGARRAC